MHTESYARSGSSPVAPQSDWIIRPTTCIGTWNRYPPFEAASPAASRFTHCGTLLDLRFSLPFATIPERGARPLLLNSLSRPGDSLRRRKMSADENTPLLPGGESQKKSLSSRLWAAVSHVENRLLFAGFLITLSFSYTQVPYVVYRLTLS